MLTTPARLARYAAAPAFNRRDVSAVLVAHWGCGGGGPEVGEGEAKPRSRNLIQRNVAH